MNHDVSRSGRLVITAALLAALLTQQAVRASNISINTVSVGNAGNGADHTGFGSVAYGYRIGATEVTNAQYAEFLNAVDPTGANVFELYSTNMSFSAAVGGGIEFNAGAASGTKYSVTTGRGNLPVNWVSWYDTIRFANWLHNGQGSGDTETGAYTLLGGTPTPSNGEAITRNPGATWVLATEDEWYKAAFHKNDGVTANYFKFATSSDSIPAQGPPPGGTNYSNEHAPYLSEMNEDSAYINSTSPYGNFDQSSNLWEWNESFFSGTDRVLRGGAFANQFGGFDFELSVDGVRFAPGDFEWFNLGFRVAVVPEPSSLAIAATALAGALFLSRRRTSRELCEVRR